MLVGYPAGQSQLSNGLIFRPPVHPLVAATLQGYHPRRPLDLVDQNQSVAIRPDARLQTIDLGSISRNGPHTMNKPPARFELTTCCLQNSRTTAVLRWRNTNSATRTYWNTHLIWQASIPAGCLGEPCTLLGHSLCNSCSVTLVLVAEACHLHAAYQHQRCIQILDKISCFQPHLCLGR